MRSKRFALLFLALTALSALIVFLPSLLAPPRPSPSPSPPPGAGPPDVVFFRETPSGNLSSCAWCGPFLAPPSESDLHEPIIGKPATTATVWAPYIGGGGLVDLSSVTSVKDGRWYVFSFLLSVPHGRAGRYTLTIRALGEMRVSVDGVFLTTVPATPISQGWYNDFEAPGDFSEAARRVTVAVRARFGSCGLLLSVVDSGRSAGALCALRWIAGTAPPPAELAARTLIVESSGVPLGDGSFRVLVRASGGLPWGFEVRSFSVAVLRGGKALGRGELPPGGECRISCPFPSSGALSLDFDVSIEVDGEPAARRSVRIYNPGAFRDARDAAASRAEALRKDRGRDAEIELRLAQLDTLLEDLARDALLGSSSSEVARRAELFCSIHTELLAVLAAAEKGRDPFAGRTGMMERAYISEVDDSPQPYRVWLPTDFYSDPRPRPAVVFLHGYVPDYTIADWGEKLPALADSCNRIGAVLFEPFGRSNTDFQTVGERDVLRVVRIAVEKFGCDARRIHLVGVSMGGMGVWTVGAHHPDVFASLVPMAGRTDYYTWHRCSPLDLPPWKNFLIRLWNPADLLPCYRYQHISIFHGREDRTVLPAHTRLIADRFREAGIPFELHWLEGGHMSVFEKIADPRFADALQDYVRPLGDKVSFRAWLPRYASRAWLSVPLFARWGEPVNAEGEVKDGVVTVSVTNALRVLIRPWPGVLWPGSKVRVVLNGVEKPPAVLPREGLAFDLGEAPSGVPLKTPDLCGPAWQVLSEPFAVVWGDGTDRFRAERFADWWHRFAKGRCPVYSAADLPPEVEKGRHLVLIGTPASNPLLASLAPSLPFGVSSGRFVLPDGTSFDATGRGLLFVYPNPRNPSRLVMVCSGLMWGRRLPVNHRFDMVPDYVLFEPAPGGAGEAADRVLVAGLFDTRWRFDPSLMWSAGGNDR